MLHHAFDFDKIDLNIYIKNEENNLFPEKVHKLAFVFGSALDGAKLYSITSSRRHGAKWMQT
jgi:hypothetical protein